jgi:hypothetical protein
VSIRRSCSDLINGLGYSTRAYLSADDASIVPVLCPDGSFQSALLPTVEFDSAAAALKVFHTNFLGSKSLVIPVQCEKSLFYLDSTVAFQPAHPASIVPPLPSAPTAPGGMGCPTGPVQPQYAVANQESGKDAHAYPTRAELYHRTPQHCSHCYKAEAEFSYAIFF